MDDLYVLVNEWDSIPVPLPGYLLAGRNPQIRREFRMMVGFMGPFLPQIPFGGLSLPVLTQIPFGFPSLFLSLNLFLNMSLNSLTDSPFHYHTGHSRYPVLSSY